MGRSSPGKCREKEFSNVEAACRYSRALHLFAIDGGDTGLSGYRNPTRSRTGLFRLWLRPARPNSPQGHHAAGDRHQVRRARGGVRAGARQLHLPPVGKGGHHRRRTPARSDGEYQQVTDITFDKDGRREEHVVFAPPNTLDNGGVMMSPTDFEEIEHRLPFILTTDRPAAIRRHLPRPPACRRTRYLCLRGRAEEDREEPPLLPGQGMGRPAGLPDRPHQRQDRAAGHAPRPRRPAAAIHHLL